jgi:23S rRNA pseudouridine1911/1915/1917 synthase
VARPRADRRAATSARGGTPPAGGATAATLAARVRALLPERSWREVRALIAAGAVRVDGVVVTDPARRPAPAARVELAASTAAAGPAPGRQRAGRLAAPGGAPGPAPPDTGGAGHSGDGSAAPVAPSDPHAVSDPRWARGIVLLHVDRDLVVAGKPAGLLTVPFAGDERDTFRDRLQVAVRRFEKARQLAGSPSLRTVQRLDKETSGLLVFARNVPTERALQEALAERSLERRYLALVHGEAGAMHCESWLLADRGDGLRGSWRSRPGATPPAEARLAITEVAMVARYRTPGGLPCTLVRCTLGTGRTHQIRIHLAEAGHPLVGDPVYGRDFRGPRWPCARLMLHAVELAFRHPRTGARLAFSLAPPPDFTDVLASLVAA